MAAITPQTDVYLLKCPLEISDINQLTFSNATAQYNYFSSLPKLSVTDFSYQRKDGTIRYGAGLDSLLSYNYVMYRNDAYSNKWFYAFITGMEYLNDGATAISIKTDVWQTWQFALTFKPCMIEREHTNDDTVGKNTLPEGLELGDLVVNGSTSNFGINATGIGDYVIVVDVSMIENPGDSQTLTYSWLNSGVTPTQYVNGIPSGLYHIIVGYNTSVIVSARDLIDVYDKAGLGNAIQNVYILPTNLVGSVQTGLTISTTGSAPAGSVSNLAMPTYTSGATTIGTGTCNRPTTVNGYTPKNKKLLVYPYNYVNVSNNAGTNVSYRYEDFSSGNATFTVEGAFCPSGSVKAVPTNYKNIASGNAYDYSINGAKYPICGWTTDAYTNWLTQNAVNMEAQQVSEFIGAGAKAIGAAWTLGMAGSPVLALAAGAVTMGASIIQNAREQHLAKTNANMTSDLARGNLSAGDVVWSKWRSQFTFIPMSVKAEYARCIDDYFSEFGYQTNRIKTPNITGRTNWNYVKTNGCYIDADIPQEDLAEIKSMFDKGITLWHNPSTFADYSQSNTIVT